MFCARKISLKDLRFNSAQFPRYPEDWVRQSLTLRPSANPLNPKLLCRGSSSSCRRCNKKESPMLSLLSADGGTVLLGRVKRVYGQKLPFCPSLSAPSRLNLQGVLRPLVVSAIKKRAIRSPFYLPTAGLEPARISPHASETCMFTDFITSALCI